MRIFVGVEIEKEVKGRISDFTEKLREIGNNVRWVKSENIHITLYFFGEVKDDSIAQVEELIQTARESIKPFPVHIGDVMAFPTIERARVLWIGVSNENRELNQIYTAIQKGITKKNIEVNREKRSYTPHITIGRLKNRPSQGFIREMNRYANIPFGSFKVNEIVLFKSTLTRSGSIYEKLRSFPF